VFIKRTVRRWNGRKTIPGPFKKSRNGEVSHHYAVFTLRVGKRKRGRQVGKKYIVCRWAEKENGIRNEAPTKAKRGQEDLATWPQDLKKGFHT